MTTKRVLPLLTGVLLIVGGCGSGKDGDSANGSTPGGDDKAELAFAKCMRAGGINVSDPDGSGRVRITVHARPGQDFSPQKVQQLTKDCRKKTGGGPREPSAAEKTEMRDRALKFAQCMRKHGIDMPDPQFGGGGGITIGGGPGKIDPASSAFQNAQKACEQFEPMLRRGGGDGPQTETAPDSAPSGGGTAVVPAP